jgi:hypothetical protein
MPAHACCLTCRLVQWSWGRCAECDGPTIELIDRYVDAFRTQPERSWTGDLLAPTVTAVTVPPLARSPAARVVHGIAHRLHRTLAIGDSLALVEQVAVTSDDDGAVFRSIRSVPFVVELDGGGRVVITGLVALSTARVSRHAIVSSDSVYERLGIPLVLRIPASLAIGIVCDGDRVVVEGESSDEVVPELGSYRDPGEVTVLRGRPGAVVVIES